MPLTKEEAERLKETVERQLVNLTPLIRYIDSLTEPEYEFNVGDEVELPDYGDNPMFKIKRRLFITKVSGTAIEVNDPLDLGCYNGMGIDGAWTIQAKELTLITRGEKRELQLWDWVKLNDKIVQVIEIDQNGLHPYRVEDGDFCIWTHRCKLDFLHHGIESSPEQEETGWWWCPEHEKAYNEKYTDTFDHGHVPIRAPKFDIGQWVKGIHVGLFKIAELNWNNDEKLWAYSNESHSFNVIEEVLTACDPPDPKFKVGDWYLVDECDVTVLHSVDEEDELESLLDDVQNEKFNVRKVLHLQYEGQDRPFEPGDRVMWQDYPRMYCGKTGSGTYALWNLTGNSNMVYLRDLNYVRFPTSAEIDKWEE